MIIEKFKLKDKLFIKISILAICLWIILTVTILKTYKNKEKIYLRSELENFSYRVEATLKTYEELSNYIFEETIEKPQVLEIIQRAGQSTGPEKVAVRKELHTLLGESYELLERYNFEQLHFHLPDGESFLRFHSPEVFGENLMDTRASVRLANFKNKYVSGFEEGRIYNGYRFVYPLSYKGNHLGSVEISIPLERLVSSFQQKYPDKDLFFIAEKELVEKNVFGEQLGDYETSSFSENYYFDKEVEVASSENANVLKDNLREKFFEQLDVDIEDKLSKKENFSIIYKFNKENYDIGFTIIENTLGNSSGYLIALSIDKEYNKMYSNMYIELILVGIISILFIVFSLYFVRNKERIEKISYYDSLTRIYNRHKFLELAKLEMERFRRNQDIFSIVLLDIDFFKKVNDNYGHNIGDEVLKSMSALILENLRKVDVFARWGGEEFIILLPSTNADKARLVAEKIRSLVEEFDFNEVGNITISLGVAQIGSNSSSIEEAVDMADQALYISKRTGRNRTSVYTKEQK